MNPVEKLSKEQRAILAPHAQHYSLMVAYVRKLTLPELDALLDVCNMATVKNCWWAEYQAAQFLRVEARAWKHRAKDKK